MDCKPLYKAAAMEEWLDLRFFHPSGYRIALWAKPLGFSPDQITYASMALGVGGGFMLASWRLAFWGWALLILSSVLDSADGQLARMGGGGSLRGRILDGMIGYFTFTAAYIGLLLLNVGSPQSIGFWPMLALALTGGMCTALESSLYDFFRTTFASVVSKRRVADESEDKARLGWFMKFSYAGYETYQRIFASSHLRLMALLRQKYPDGLPQEVSERYLKANRGNVHLWNLLGDNTRFLLIGLCLILHRPHWYFFFIMGPLAALMLAMAWRQRRTDEKLICELNLEAGK